MDWWLPRATGALLPGSCLPRSGDPECCLSYGKSPVVGAQGLPPLALLPCFTGAFSLVASRQRLHEGHILSCCTSAHVYFALIRPVGWKFRSQVGNHFLSEFRSYFFIYSSSVDVKSPSP